MPDHLTLYDGDLYNLTTKSIVTIKVDGNEGERSLYQTTRSNPMSIKFHATGAREHLGFVAEVVTLPISAVGLDRLVIFFHYYIFYVPLKNFLHVSLYFNSEFLLMACISLLQGC